MIAAAAARINNAFYVFIATSRAQGREGTEGIDRDVLRRFIDRLTIRNVLALAVRADYLSRIA